MDSNSDLKNLPIDLFDSLKELGEYDEETLRSFADFPISFGSTSLNPDPESRAEALKREEEMKNMRNLLKGKNEKKGKAHPAGQKRKTSNPPQENPSIETSPTTSPKKLSGSPPPLKTPKGGSILNSPIKDRTVSPDHSRVGSGVKSWKGPVCPCGAIECARGGFCQFAKKVQQRASEDVPPSCRVDKLAKLKEFVNGDDYSLIPARELMERVVKLVTESGDMDLVKHWEMHSHHYVILMEDHKTNFLQRLLRELALGATHAAASLRGYLVGREYSEMEVTREKLDRYETMVTDLEVYMKGVKDSQENHNAQIRKLCDQVNNASGTIAEMVKGAESIQLAVNKLDTIPRAVSKIQQKEPPLPPPQQKPTKTAFSFRDSGPSNEPVPLITGDGTYVTPIAKIKIEKGRLVSFIDDTNTLQQLKPLLGKHVSLVKIILNKTLQNLLFAFEGDPRWLSAILDAPPEEAKVKLLAFHRLYPDHKFQWSRMG